jgi:outer membrane protein
MIKFLGSLYLLIGWSAVAQAQVRISTLQEALNYADKTGTVGRQSTLQQQISRKDEAINKSDLLPKLNLFGTSEYDPLIPVLVVPSSVVGGSAGKYQKVQLGLPWTFSAGAELSFPVINFEKWEQLKRYKLQSLQTEWTSKVNQESLHIQLTQAYYQVLITRELVALNQLDLEITEELMRVMESRKGNGVLDPADYNRSKNLWLDTRSTQIDYQRNYAQSLIDLRQLLVLPDSADLELNDSIASVAEAWTTLPEKRSITERPAWQEAAVKVAVAELQRKEANRAGLPVISLDSKYTHELQMEPGQHIAYDFSSIGLRLDFPIFRGNYYRLNQQKAELQGELARTTQEQTAADLRHEEQEWWNNFLTAVKKQDVLKQKLTVEEDNLRIARLNMREGVMEFDEFNNIFKEYNKARMDYLQNIDDGIVYQMLLNLKN